MALTQGLQLPFGIQPVNALLVDSYAGPYNSVAEALSSIPSALRVQTRFVNIIDSGVGKLYWFKDGIADGDLVEFSSASGTVTSVGLSMPSAFSVANSPVTSSGTLTVTGAGLASQYVRGDGTLGDFPSTTGGGSSVSYYLNGSVNQGTFGGNTYYEMNKTPILGTGTDFSTSSDGYIASFITDVGDPNKLLIPAGNWNLELYFSASSGGGNPSFYVELYKYNGTTFTLIASSSAAPELISLGTTINPYFAALAVTETPLALTDRLALRVYVTTSGRTITLHTEDNHLCQIITTFSTGLTALNGLTAQVQYLTTGTSGTDFNIASSSDTHTFNIPVASATNTGKLSSTDWSTFNSKEPAIAAGTTLQYFRGDKTFQTLNTSVVPESGNLYFTNSRARSAISLTTIGASGVATYDSGTGVLNIPQYQAALTNPVTGTGTTNYLPKFTGTSAIGDSQVFDNGTNVGIGTTSPSRLLHLSSAGDTYLRVDGQGFESLFGSDANGTVINQTGLTGISLRTANSDRMRITAGGRILMGTTSDNGTDRLQVSGSATFSSSVTAIGNVTTSSYFNLSSPSTSFGAGTSNSAWAEINTGTAFNVRVNGGDRFIVNSLGNVGIGTASPVSVGGYIGTTTNATTGSFHFLAVGGVNKASFETGGSVTQLKTLVGEPLILGTNNITRLTIAADGAATFSSSVTANSFMSVVSADQTSARFIVQNTGTGGSQYAMMAGNVNVDQTGFSIFKYGFGNILRFDANNAATFASSVSAASASISGNATVGALYTNTIQMVNATTLGINNASGTQLATISHSTGILNAIYGLQIDNSVLNTPRSLLYAANRSTFGDYGAIDWYNYQWDGFTKASIAAQTDGALSNGALAFKTSDGGSNATTRMLIKGNGTAIFYGLVNIGNDNSGSNYLRFSYQSHPNSRSFRLSPEQVEYGDFSIQRSTTQTGSSYQSLVYWNGAGDATFLKSGLFNGELTSVTESGGIYIRNSSAMVELHVRPNNDKDGYISFTENADSDRWSIGITANDARFHFRVPYRTSTSVFNIDGSGNVVATGAATFSSSVTAGGFSATGNGNLGTFTTTGSGSGYGLIAQGTSGGARDIFIAGQIGFSNGFTVQYDGTIMRYALLNGNVGIGALSSTNASIPLSLNTTGTNIGSQVLFTNSYATAYCGISADTRGDVTFQVDGTGSGSDKGIKLNTNGNNTRLYVTSGGEVYIAGLADQGAYNLQVNGTGVWAAGAYVNGSDQRLKENIQDIDKGLEYIKKVRPVKFNYKRDYSRDRNVHTGFIAQQLQSVFANEDYLGGMVQEGAHLNVAYQNLIPIMVKAIQEQQIEIENLKAQLK